MITKILETTFDAVINQGYERGYIFQAIPVLGAIISIPTAILSGVMATIKIAQAIFEKIRNSTPFFQNRKHPMSPMENAVDLSLIFLNNVANICTLGILNSVIVWITLDRSATGED